MSSLQVKFVTLMTFKVPSGYSRIRINKSGGSGVIWSFLYFLTLSIKKFVTIIFKTQE